MISKKEFAERVERNGSCSHSSNAEHISCDDCPWYTKCDELAESLSTTNLRIITPKIAKQWREWQAVKEAYRTTGVWTENSPELKERLKDTFDVFYWVEHNNRNPDIGLAQCAVDMYGFAHDEKDTHITADQFVRLAHKIAKKLRKAKEAGK